MSSTQALIQKTKVELQKLREEYLRVSSDPQEAARIANRINHHKRVLAELGVKNG